MKEHGDSDGPGPLALRPVPLSSGGELRWGEFVALEAGGLVDPVDAGAFEGALAYVDPAGRTRAVARAARVAWEPPPQAEPLSVSARPLRLSLDSAGETLLGVCFEADAEGLDAETLRRAHHHGRVRLARELGVRWLVVVAPLSGYGSSPERWAARMGPAAWVQQVRSGAVCDLPLGLALEAGLTPRTLVETEQGWVAVMAWENPAR